MSTGLSRSADLELPLGFPFTTKFYQETLGAGTHTAVLRQVPGSVPRLSSNTGLSILLTLVYLGPAQL